MSLQAEHEWWVCVNCGYTLTGKIPFFFLPALGMLISHDARKLCLVCTTTCMIDEEPRRHLKRKKKCRSPTFGTGLCLQARLAPPTPFSVVLIASPVPAESFNVLFDIFLSHAKDQLTLESSTIDVLWSGVSSRMQAGPPACHGELCYGRDLAMAKASSFVPVLAYQNGCSRSSVLHPRPPLAIHTEGEIWYFGTVSREGSKRQSQCMFSFLFFFSTAVP